MEFTKHIKSHYYTASLSYKDKKCNLTVFGDTLDCGKYEACLTETPVEVYNTNDGILYRSKRLLLLEPSDMYLLVKKCLENDKLTVQQNIGGNTMTVLVNFDYLGLWSYFEIQIPQVDYQFPITEDKQKYDALKKKYDTIYDGYVRVCQELCKLKSDNMFLKTYNEQLLKDIKY